ncbi:MAG: T9SS type A sorting domain-containing protein [Bacteroidota bacterium]
MRQSFTLLLVALLVSAGSVFAQERVAKPGPTLEWRSIMPEGLSFRAVQDTFLTALQQSTEACVDSPTVFGINNQWGTVVGNNGYGDKEKIQTFQYNDQAEFKLLEYWTVFGVRAVGNDGDLTAVVYATNGDGSPGALLATSNPVKVSETADSLRYTQFVFATPPDVNSPIFQAGIDFNGLYATNDTVGMIHTRDGCGTGGFLWEKWSDDRWFRVDSAWGGLTVETYGIAVVEFEESSSIDGLTAEGLTIFPAYPNPANDQVNLKFNTVNSGNVNVKIYGSDTRVVATYPLGIMAPGEHNFKIDTQAWASGAYYFSIETEDSRLTSKFIVTK